MWKDVVRHYVRSKRFVADVVCVIPLDAPCKVFTNMCDRKVFAFLRVNRLVKLYKVNTHTRTHTHTHTHARTHARTRAHTHAHTPV